MRDRRGRLEGKIALVTGVASPKGVGYATAKAIAREGATLAITDISPEVHERALELQEMGYDVQAFQTDLTVLGQVESMVDEIARMLGRLDILANVAGLAPRGSSEVFKYFVDLTEEEWDWSLNINLKTTFNSIRTVLPKMIANRYGRIVNVSSTTGTVTGIAGEVPYAAAKGGILGLTRALALEVAEEGITVNAVAPGWVDTGSTTEAEKQAGLATPAGRAGKPEEVADLILFLASDESTYITGQLIVIDGANSVQEYKSANVSSSVK